MAIFMKRAIFEFTLWSIRDNKVSNNYLLLGLLGIAFIYLSVKLIQINGSIKNRGGINE